MQNKRPPEHILFLKIRLNMVVLSDLSINCGSFSFGDKNCLSAIRRNESCGQCKKARRWVSTRTAWGPVCLHRFDFSRFTSNNQSGYSEMVHLSVYHLQDHP